jgi:hypothetical protein
MVTSVISLRREAIFEEEYSDRLGMSKIPAITKEVIAPREKRESPRVVTAIACYSSSTRVATAVKRACPPGSKSVKNSVSFNRMCP